jgi:hypothetical protein
MKWRGKTILHGGSYSIHPHGNGFVVFKKTMSQMDNGRQVGAASSLKIAKEIAERRGFGRGRLASP